MKKAKLMLMGVVVISIVGGALAFKVKESNTLQTVCYNTSIAGTTCTASFPGLVSVTAGSLKYHYTIVSNPAECTNGVVTCPSTAQTIEPE
jgi:hypothetical protein